MDEKCPQYVREGYSMIDELAGQGKDGEYVDNDFVDEGELSNL